MSRFAVIYRVIGARAHAQLIVLSAGYFAACVNMTTFLWTCKLISDALRKLYYNLDILRCQTHSNDVFQNVLHISYRISQLRFHLHRL